MIYLLIGAAWGFLWAFIEAEYFPNLPVLYGTGVLVIGATILALLALLAGL